MFEEARVLSHAERLRMLTVAIDGSDAAQTALKTACRLARPAEARLRLVSVTPRTPGMDRHPHAAAPLVEALRDDTERTLAEAARHVQDAGLQVETKAHEGTPASEIAHDVDTHTPDMVVVGSRGLGGTRVHTIGSVGYSVVQGVDVPVLVVHRPAAPRRILVPVDGSDTATHAAWHAAGLARHHQAKVTLLYVIPKGFEEVKFTVTRGAARPFLGPLESELKEADVAVDHRIEHGNPARTVLSVAGKDDHDLIVMGRVGKAGPAGFALGGVTDKVLHHADRSVLIVP